MYSLFVLIMSVTVFVSYITALYFTNIFTLFIFITILIVSLVLLKSIIIEAGYLPYFLALIYELYKRNIVSNITLVILIYSLPLIILSVIAIIIARKEPTRDRKIINNIKTMTRMLRSPAVIREEYIRYYITTSIVVSLILYSLDIFLSNPLYSSILNYILLLNISTSIPLFILLASLTIEPKEVLINTVIEASMVISPSPILARIAEEKPLVKHHLRKCSRQASIGVIKAILEYEPVNSYTDYFFPPREDKTRWWFSQTPTLNYCIDIRDNRKATHIIVTGSTGSGKTYLAKKILAQVLGDKDNLVVVIDPHGEYTRDKQLENAIEITDLSYFFFTPINETPKERANEITEILKQFFNIGQLQEYLLYDSILGAYEDKGYQVERVYNLTSIPPLITFKDVTENLKKIIKENSEYRESVTTLIRYLERFSAGLQMRPENIGKAIKVVEALGKNENRIIIANLSKIKTTYHKYMVAEALLRILYYGAPELGKRKKIIIVVDEAHLFLPRTSKQPILLKIIRETRKYSTTTILVTQNITDVHEEILNNFGAFFSLRVVEEKNLEKTAKILSGFLERERIIVIERMLSKMPQGYALVKDRSISEPVLIKIKSSRNKQEFCKGSIRQPHLKTIGYA